MSYHPPCPAWAEKLVRKPADLSGEEREALAAHIHVCKACRTAQHDYSFIIASLKKLPSPTVHPLPRLSLLLEAEENRYAATSLEQEDDRRLERWHVSSRKNTWPARQKPVRRSRFSGAISTWMAFVSVAVIVLAIMGVATWYQAATTAASEAGATQTTYNGHTEPVSAVAWSPDRNAVASASWDHTVRVWSSSGALVKTYTGHKDIVSAVAWSPDGKYIASGGQNGLVHIWNAVTGEQLNVYDGHTNNIDSLAWLPEKGKYIIASGSWDHTIKIWHAFTDELIRDIRSSALEIDEIVDALSWSPDGTRIASANRKSLVQVWEVQTGALLFNYTRHTDLVNSVSWSPDGKYIASGSQDGTIHVWDAQNGTTEYVYSGHTDAVGALSWFPQKGKYIIASAGRDTTVRIWKALSGETTLVYREHKDTITTLSWSPDGTFIVSGGGLDPTIKVWRTFTG